jgi:hypothetical protein
VAPDGRGHPTSLGPAVDHEYEELMEEETAEPKESLKESNYHSYHSHFSHFPRTPAPRDGLSGLTWLREIEGRNDTARIAMDARPGPGFPATLHWTEPRVRLSMKKGA